MKNILIALSCLFLCSCAFISGGADYEYERFDPETGAKIIVSVHSTREIDSAKICFRPDGSADVEIEGVKPGPNNLGQALTVIEALAAAVGKVP